MIEIPANVTGVQDLFADLVGGAMTGGMPVESKETVSQDIMVQ
jgi:hypothetical protein